MLGGVQPCFEPVRVLSDRSPDEAKAPGDSHLCQGAADFSTAQNVVWIAQTACSLLPHNTDGSFGSFRVILTIKHATDVIIPGNPIILSNIFP